jgi:hypothetical protein
MSIDTDPELRRPTGHRRRTWIPRVLATMAVALATVGFGAAPAHAHHGGLHRIDMTGTIYLLDDETFGDDETASYAFSGWHDSSTVTGWVEVLNRDFCAGDEVRVNLRVSLRLVPSGNAEIQSSATFYEGTSCSTTDHDGDSSAGPAAATWNSFNTLSYRVNNTAEGNDWAQISLCVENDANAWAQHC